MFKSIASRGQIQSTVLEYCMRPLLRSFSITNLVKVEKEGVLNYAFFFF